MLNFLIMGVVLGLSAGLAPGPLLTLVISETLQHGVRSGVRVSLAPLITDLPIIMLTFFILTKLSDFHNMLGIISLTGGLFILFMGYESIRTKPVGLDGEMKQPRSLTKGILANVLNPHPYLFWISVGAPTMTRAMHLSAVALVGFICGFYAALVGSKIVLAILVGRSKSFLVGKGYLYTLRFLGLALFALAFALFRDGLRLLGLI